MQVEITIVIEGATGPRPQDLEDHANDVAEKWADRIAEDLGVSYAGIQYWATVGHDSVVDENPLTDEQHQDGFLRADAEGDAWGLIGARARAHGDAPRLREVERYHAQARGAQKAHRWAMDGEIWPERSHGRAAQQAFEVEYGSPYYGLSAAYGPDENPCGAGGYGYPPQAVPATNPKSDGKWHKNDNGIGYYLFPRDTMAYSIISPYSPRSTDPRKAEASRFAASKYEQSTGHKIPTGTKWIVYYRDGDHLDEGTASAHRTLAPAKRAGSAALSTRSNPWTQAASGPMASSFNPPPSPVGRLSLNAGPMASSFNPPPSPFGSPDYESGMLQGADVNRSAPGWYTYGAPT